ncbi:Pyridine nucleotide-disulfide oxidoreductase family protein [Oleidesulfovibrio alaskensis G20]|uniref:Pyridine nucleotide-disulfide oxidoreductase family protein n=1 Tax=Oleidesulfovibrio alaskensis (strain ATCC BAA-1058 / DSM 17464 / G20) TaxID=207559 RepID=Q30Y88_OLEA2|nr:FAD-dependent oxidoreductase [Oleidesulfovibrio alaskensis]ABB39358.1 Pyridine nucleotide-disulfide oxidoreductase family protein [Oleidesulfovibrio alaskensis G20]MBG0773795.1 FAD-dependent oxidoreductase [Oleidesulfovibrio alaskensis]
MARLLLLGAGHAHMTVMAHLPEIIARGHTVTAVGPLSRHYYSGMGPGMLGGAYTPEDISFPVEQMIESRGGEFIRDKAVRVDAAAKTVTLQSGLEVAYDVCSFNTGSSVPVSIVQQDAEDVYTVKPIENLLAGRNRILELAAKDTVRIGVVGGGPAALEVAGNAAACARESGGKGASVRLYAGKRFLRGLTPRVRSLCLRQMHRHNVEILEGSYASGIATGKVTLEDGRTFAEDIIFVAMGVKPSALITASGLPAGDDGGLAVNRFLQCDEHPDLFGGGDCIWFKERPLDKVGVYAVRENPVLYHNLLARLEGGELQPFDPGGDYLLIFNTGGGTGVLHKSGVSFGGRLAFVIKDWIDRRFMREFQP